MSDADTVRFLLVEDNEDHAALVLRSFGRSGANSTVDHVSDGVEALGYLRREGEYQGREQPDVVLLDLNLPKLNGHDVLAAIRGDEGLTHLPVVIFTTSDAEFDRFQAYAKRANSYVVKPLDFGELRRVIDDLCQYWGTWNRPAP